MRSLPPRLLRDVSVFLGKVAGGLGYWSEDAGKLLKRMEPLSTPKRSTVLAHKRVAKKKRTRKEKTVLVREAVMARAGGHCEYVGVDAGHCSGPLQLDHFFSGSGRRTSLESAETCWALCAGHHHLKTLNQPNSAYWLQAFVYHCRRHAFPGAELLAQARLDSLSLQGRSP